MWLIMCHFHWGQLFITLLVWQTLMNHLLVFTIRWVRLPTPDSFPVVTVLNIVKLVYNHMMIKTRFKSGIGPLSSLCICNSCGMLQIMLKEVLSSFGFGAKSTLVVVVGEANIEHSAQTYNAELALSF